MGKIYGFLAILGLCFALAPVLAYLLGGWWAYWGHGVLAIIFAIIAVMIKTRYYWEDE
jgi:4-hydroxybenzoate polyprenyltransferase